MTRAGLLALSDAPGPWADDEDGTELDRIRWAAAAASELVTRLMRLEEAAEARLRWDLPDRPFARTTSERLHTRACHYVNRASADHRPLTTAEAGAFLRESHEHRRCSVCRPDIGEPSWVQVRPPGGRVRWRLADDVELP
jgi:hypothetical protein